MRTVTFSEARQKFSWVLDKAKSEGKVIIIRRDGSEFELKPIKQENSPLDVAGINLDLTTNELIDIIREIRER